MGGAMDILAGTKTVIIATTLTAKNGRPKLLRECTLPLTAVRCVSTVVTEKCIAEIRDEKFHIVSMYPGITEEEIREAIDADIIFDDNMQIMVE